MAAKIAVADATPAVALGVDATVAVGVVVDASPVVADKSPVDVTRLLRDHERVALLKPHAEKHAYQDETAGTADLASYHSVGRSIFVQRIIDAKTKEVIATVRIESLDVEKGQRTIEIKASDGTLIARSDKPPRAEVAHLITDEPSTFTVGGQPYATFTPGVSATAFGQIERVGGRSGLKLEGRKSAKMMLGIIAAPCLPGGFLLAMSTLRWAVGSEGSEGSPLGMVCMVLGWSLMLLGLILASYVPHVPTKYGVQSLDGGAQYPRLKSWSRDTNCACRSYTDDGTKMINFGGGGFLGAGHLTPLDTPHRFDMLLLMVAMQAYELLPVHKFDGGVGDSGL